MLSGCGIRWRRQGSCKGSGKKSEIVGEASGVWGIARLTVSAMTVCCPSQVALSHCTLLGNAWIALMEGNFSLICCWGWMTAKG